MEKKDRLVYFFIVLLGFLAFVLSTLFFSKTRSAEAATAWDINATGPFNDLPRLEEFYEHSYKDVTAFDLSNSYLFRIGDKYHLFYSPYYPECLFIQALDNEQKIYCSESFRDVAYDTVLHTFTCSGFVGWASSYDLTPSDGFVWGRSPGRYEGSNSWNQKKNYYSAISEYPAAVVPPHYEAGGPYLACDNFVLRDELVTDPTATYIRVSHMSFDGHIGNVQLRSGSYDVQAELEVWLPTPSLFETWKDDIFRNMNTSEENRISYLIAAVKEYRNSVSDDVSVRSIFRIPVIFSVTVDELNTCSFRLSFQDVLDAIFDKYGFTLQSWYQQSTGQALSDDFLPYYMAYLTPVRLTSLVYKDNVYGKYTITEFLNVVGGKVAGQMDFITTFLQDDVENIDNIYQAVKDTVTDAYKNEIKNKDNVINHLTEQVFSMQQVEGIYSDFNTSDVFYFIKSSIAGLLGMTASIASLAAVVQIAFSFLPMNVTALLVGVFMIILFTAIIRALRG